MEVTMSVGSWRPAFAAAVVVALAVTIGPATATVPTNVPTVTYRGTVQQFPAPVSTRTYPVYNARGQRTGMATWRVTGAGDNCCEDYISVTSSGELVTFGGTYPMVSSNDGKTWYEVKPPTPLNNGEGAIVAGPNGEIYGIGWDAYSGDHLQAFRYDAANNVWSVSEVPIHNPFFDRPWITVARGPFVIDHRTYTNLVLVRGGGENKDPELASPDGLMFTDLTSPYLDEQSSKPTSVAIPVVRNPAADYWQPHPWAGTVPLTGGGLLQITQPNDGDFATCPVSYLAPGSGTWRCDRLSFPGESTWTSAAEVCCQLRQDSRGWLTDVIPNRSGTALLLYLSTDGGRRWSTPAVLSPPRGLTLEAGDLYNVVTNGRLGIAAVSARFDLKNGDGQDMVFRVDIQSAQPRLLETYLLGKGDIQTANNVTGSGGDRMDYCSVAIEPSGALIASFDDSTTVNPTETLMTSAGALDRSVTKSNQPDIAILLP
jgi:hypothetical protein